MLGRLTCDLARPLPGTGSHEKPGDDADANQDNDDRGDEADAGKQSGESKSQQDRPDDHNSDRAHASAATPGR